MTNRKLIFSLGHGLELLEGMPDTQEKLRYIADIRNELSVLRVAESEAEERYNSRNASYLEREGEGK